jgi:hypothetical protein
VTVRVVEQVVGLVEPVEESDHVARARPEGPVKRRPGVGGRRVVVGHG